MAILAPVTGLSRRDLLAPFEVWGPTHSEGAMAVDRVTQFLGPPATKTVTIVTRQKSHPCYTRDSAPSHPMTMRFCLPLRVQAYEAAQGLQIQPWQGDAWRHLKAWVMPRRRIVQLLTFILVAVWVLQYLGGVALRPKEVGRPSAVVVHACRKLSLPEGRCTQVYWLWEATAPSTAGGTPASSA